MKKKLLLSVAFCLVATAVYAAVTFTTHYAYTQPQIGASQNVWGSQLNTDLASIDSNMWSASGGMTIGLNAPSSSSSNITLTNSINNVQNISFSTTGKSLILPPMNVTASMVVGGPPLYINNVGSNAFAILANDGSTSVLASLPAGQSVSLQLLTNSTANGTFQTYGPYLSNIGTLVLGTSASVASPSISGDTTTGFYTAGAGKVDVSISGTNSVEWTSTGEVLTGTLVTSALTTALGFSPSGSTATGNRLYLPSTNTPAISANGIEVAQFNTATSGVNYLSFTPAGTGAAPSLASAGSDTNINLALTPAGTGSLNLTSGSLLFAGVNALWEDNTNFNTVGGKSAAPSTISQSGGGLNGTDNTAFGYLALNANTTGADNTAIGKSALLDDTTGANNTAIGSQALISVSTASNNTALGTNALANALGSSNTGIGYNAGNSGTAIMNGTNNTMLGALSQVNSATATNRMALGYSAASLSDNDITLGNSSIATIHAEVTSITGISDRRRKKDIESSDLGLDFILELKPVKYRYNNGDETLRYGIIAQDLETALPDNLEDLVETSKPGYGLAMLEKGRDAKRTYSVAYGELISPLIKAIQEQEAEIVELKQDKNSNVCSHLNLLGRLVFDCH